MHQIERGIFYEDSFLGVTLGGLVFSHGTVMIDAPLRSEDARSWRSALLSQRGGSHRLMIALDSHPDRTLGARTLDCTLLTHQKAADLLRNRPAIFKGQSIETGAAWEIYGDAIGMRWANPDITFTDRMFLHWGGPELVLEQHPGPAPGSIWVTLPEERIVFVGDAVTPNQPPFLAHADIPIWIATLDELANTFQDYLIISGRGGPVVPKDIAAAKELLLEIQNQLENMASKGRPPEATQEIARKILSKKAYPSELKEQYLQRLGYGLYQYYLRTYLAAPPLEETDLEPEES